MAWMPCCCVAPPPPCCPDDTPPDTLTILFASACGCIDGVSLTLTRVAGTDRWEVTSPAAMRNICSAGAVGRVIDYTVTVECKDIGSGDRWYLTIQINTFTGIITKACEFGSNIVTTTADCDPLELVFDGTMGDFSVGAIPCDCNGVTYTATVTI